MGEILPGRGQVFFSAGSKENLSAGTCMERSGTVFSVCRRDSLSTFGKSILEWVWERDVTSTCPRPGHLHEGM